MFSNQLFRYNLYEHEEIDQLGLVHYSDSGTKLRMSTLKSKSNLFGFNSSNRPDAKAQDSLVLLCHQLFVYFFVYDVFFHITKLIIFVNLMSTDARISLDPECKLNVL